MTKGKRTTSPGGRPSVSAEQAGAPAPVDQAFAEVLESAARLQR
ncbi:MAG: hypothetical protein ABJD68_00740 [Nakamurella sp.]